MLVKKVFYRELVSNAVKILTVLIFILPITELFKLLEQNNSGNIPATTLATLMIYGTIASFPQILTISCFLTVVITVNRYCKDHEFSVWLASGVSPFFWLRRVSIFVIPFTIICALCTMYITPWATEKSNQYTEYLSKQQTSILISPGVFKENDGGKQVFFLDHYSLSTGYAKNIFMQYVDADGITYNVTATDGKLENNHFITSLILQNGHRDQITPQQNSSYSKVDLTFGELKASIRTNYVPPKSQNTNISTSSINHLVKISNKGNTNAKAELSWRISNAIMMFVMAFLVLPISIQLGRVQGSLVFIAPPIIYAIYSNLILTMNGYVNQGRIDSMLIVQSIHVVLIMLGILLTYYKTYPQGYLFSKNKYKPNKKMVTKK